MTLDFHPLTLADRQTVWKYVEHSGRRNCDLSFANLYAWRPLFRTEISEWGGFLLFRFYADGHLAYLMPVGDGNLRDVMDALLEDSCRLNHPLLILGVCDDLLPAVRESLDGDVRINGNRDYADYVYLRQSLATLAGKKLQAKRNHVHHFKNTYPDYRYEPLSEQWVPACLQLSRRWEEAHVERSRRRSVEAEAEAIQRALTHHRELGLHGGVLLVGDRLAAFTYGAPISNDTFDVCVEKAYEKFESAYAVINQEFAANIRENFIYVNREEDMGVEGLRKAKLSYHPAILLTKYSVWTAQMLKPKMKTAGLSDRDFLVKTQVRALWKLCFNDTEPFMNLYFNHKYQPGLNSYIEENGRVISALQRLPYQMVYGCTTLQVAYVSGVCTHPERRGQHLASTLMEQAHRQMHADGKSLAVLIPAHDSLTAFYQPLGYLSLTPATHRPCILPQQCINPVCTTYTTMPQGRLKEWQSYLDAQLRHVPYAILHDADDLYTALTDVFQCNGCVAEARTDEHCCGLLIAVPTAGHTMILEQFADSNDVATLLLRAACRALNADSQATIQCNAVMIRVINVHTILDAYASQHPNLTTRILITGDKHIADNNGLYVLRNGKSEKATATDGDYKEIPIGLLPQFLFPDASPHLSLMNN